MIGRDAFVNAMCVTPLMQSVVRVASSATEMLPDRLRPRSLRTEFSLKQKEMSSLRPHLHRLKISQGVEDLYTFGEELVDTAVYSHSRRRM